MTPPRCCRWGFSEEGFVHFWITHAPDAAKDSALHLAELGADPWRRWVEAALRAEGQPALEVTP